MFLQHYKLREQPFGVTPDPRFLYFSQTHREALASLSYGIESGCGFLTLIAHPGMGKTTLLFHLLEKLRGSAQTVFLFQTQCGSREFFRYLLTDLGADASEQNLARMHESLNAVLLRNARMGRRVVLVIDEAQNLSDSVLETVRLLSDFETSQAKLLQIVLSGQPQLADKLSHPALMQLRQRISIVARLHPFTRVETMVYLEYRLCKAGYSGPPLFQYEAVELIVAHSGGIPRNINTICFNALTLAYAKRQKQVDASIVREVLADLDIEELGHQSLAPGLVAPDSLTSFDGLSPKDEKTFEDFHDAVRAAWGNGIDVKTKEALVEGDQGLFKPGNGNYHLESIPKASVGSQTMSEFPVDLDRESAQNAAVHFGSTSTPPVVSPALTREKIPEVARQRAQTRTEECSLPTAPREVRALDGEDWQVPAAGSSEPKVDFKSSRRAIEKHGHETPELNFCLLTSSTEALPNNIGKWVRAMSRFLQHHNKKIVGAWNQSQSARGRTKIVVAFALIVSGALFSERVNQSVQLRRGLAVATPVPNAIKPKPPRTIDTIKTFDASKEVSERPHRTPDDDSTMVTLEPGQTLSWLSFRYLGRFNDQVTQQIQMLNPEIKNPDRILAGTQLRLPVWPGVSEVNAILPRGVSSIGERSR